jgi:pilus assembly protein Flp/PilA
MGKDGMTRPDRRDRPVRRTLARFCRDDSGATAIEYAIIASGVGVAVAATVMSLGSKLKSMLTTLSNLLT